MQVQGGKILTRLASMLIMTHAMLHKYQFVAKGSSMDVVYASLWQEHWSGVVRSIQHVDPLGHE